MVADLRRLSELLSDPLRKLDAERLELLAGGRGEGPGPGWPSRTVRRSGTWRPAEVSHKLGPDLRHLVASGRVGRRVCGVDGPERLHDDRARGQRVNHLWSAGTTYQGAHGVLVLVSILSKAR